MNSTITILLFNGLFWVTMIGHLEAVTYIIQLYVLFQMVCRKQIRDYKNSKPVRYPSGFT